MILKIFTKSDESIERDAIELGQKLENEKNNVQYFDLNDDESYLQAEIYDIYSTPALVVTQDDGRLVEAWQGEVPLESELKNFMRI